ncbi:MAG: AraC family transcriptional regulator [Bdellovibrionales bacterium]|nr:AraC family transcriptional regulator [Bdellovibrionales bacterium]
MNKKKNIKLTHFHRSQIGRAQRFIRLNSAEDLSLKKIAKEAGSSEYHFGRMFLAYTGETTFTYLRRIRLLTALKMLQEDNECPITEIALSVGYETHSAFNKIFKATLKISPSDFRHLGQAEKNKLLYDLSITPIEKETPMNLNLKPEIISRPAINLVYVEKSGIFKEVAMPTWYELIPLVDKNIPKDTIREFLGISIMDSQTQDESTMYYGAGVVVTEEPKKLPKGLQYKKMLGGAYAKFMLVGPTHQVWDAFDKIFRVLAESKIKLRPGACIENYLSNPELVPENELVTELLVPIEE